MRHNVQEIVYLTNGNKFYADGYHDESDPETRPGFITFFQILNDDMGNMLFLVNTTQILMRCETEEWPAWYSPPSDTFAWPDFSRAYINFYPSSGVKTEQPKPPDEFH